MLPSEWTKRLVDLNVTKLTDDDLAWADYAFISSMVVQRTSAQHIIKRCKELGVKVVAGGPLFTSEHEQFKNREQKKPQERITASFNQMAKRTCADTI